jgi:hypothetical protein
MILFVGCAASPPEPIEFTDEESVEATVTAVDVERQLVTLRAAAGDEITIRVPAARNLSQVDSGDTLLVTYSERFRASLAESGKTESGASLAAGRAEEGDLPGGFLSAEAVTTVEIVSVAEDGSSVSVRDEAGRLQTLEVQREQGRAFARKLKRGDMVVLEYTEAVAMDLQKQAR